MRLTLDILIASPVRHALSDDPADILTFAIEAFHSGGCVLATLVEIRGGAARSLGAQVAVAADGRFCGYVSGGCVEAAVAAEALSMLAKNSDDRVIRFGQGSGFFDIVLPCGGGISVALHRIRDVTVIDSVVSGVQRRVPISLLYDPDRQKIDLGSRCEKAGWTAHGFLIPYHPPTRLLIAGTPAESKALAALGQAARFEVNVADPARRDWASDADRFTAIALLYHDLDDEEHFLREALKVPAFYIGALGSSRTHSRRVSHLKACGVAESSIKRIKAPIGMFGPARDSISLAVSIVADIVATRLAAGV